MPLIDIHHHLVFGMDDGAQTVQDTQRMLQRAHLEGVRHIIATPHVEPGHREFAYDQYLQRLQQTRHAAEALKTGVKVYPGAEIFYTEATVRLLREKRVPTLAGSDCVLIEFSPMAPYEQLTEAARKLQNAGYQPIFAHVERYRCLGRISRVRELHDEYHVLMQMNAGSIVNRLPLLREVWKKRVLESGWIDIAASDAHDTLNRPCRMQACYRTLSQMLGRTMAENLCRNNAKQAIFGR